MTIDNNADPANTIVILTVASVPIPASSDGIHPADTHLVGIGLITARPHRDDWATELHICTIAAGQSEGVLLEQVTRLLPASGMLAGWRIAETVLPPVLSAATANEPETAQRFLKALAPLATDIVIDLALCPPDGSDAPFVPRHDPTPGRPAFLAEITESAWATGRPQALEIVLRAQVETLWRMWLDRFQRSSPGEPA